MKNLILGGRGKDGQDSSNTIKHISWKWELHGGRKDGQQKNRVSVITQWEMSEQISNISLTEKWDKKARNWTKGEATLGVLGQKGGREGSIQRDGGEIGKGRRKAWDSEQSWGICSCENPMGEARRWAEKIYSCSQSHLLLSGFFAVVHASRGCIAKCACTPHMENRVHRG